MTNRRKHKETTKCHSCPPYHWSLCPYHHRCEGAWRSDRSRWRHLSKDRANGGSTVEPATGRVHHSGLSPLRGVPEGFLGKADRSGECATACGIAVYRSSVHRVRVRCALQRSPSSEQPATDKVVASGSTVFVSGIAPIAHFPRRSSTRTVRQLECSV